MQVVGHYLQVEAMRSRSPEEKDLFGRSSYNRYYYATFILIKELVSNINPEWVTSKHAEYPDIFSKKIVGRLRKEKTTAKRVGDPALVSDLERAISSAFSLANLLFLANSARKVADYDLSIKVDFSGSSRFSLSSVDVTAAHQWPDRAQIFGKQILSVWRQIDAA